MHTNSLVNLIFSDATAPKPSIGLGCTMLAWTDRHGATIVAMSKSGKTLTAQQDNAERVDTNGMSESQEYSYTPNINGATRVYTLRKNGQYVEQGQSLASGSRLAIGFRNTYHDYSF